jgi:hypothetical protein
VQDKKSDDRHVIGPDSKWRETWIKLQWHLNMLPLELCRNKPKAPYESQWLPNSLSKKISLFNPDIVHLHWICHGFVPVEFLKKINKPIIWTLHDMWAFTGGCHYNEECESFA